ncbi:hypothetical protein BASA83_000839 [Batrachochytrium salamandrivorans]|nr:hypothetical protein BASA83_000839 [Batrachochytrium salamandrivorans]
MDGVDNSMNDLMLSTFVTQNERHHLISDHMEPQQPQCRVVVKPMSTANSSEIKSKNMQHKQHATSSVVPRKIWAPPFPSSLSIPISQSRPVHNRTESTPVLYHGVEGGRQRPNSQSYQQKPSMSASPQFPLNNQVRASVHLQSKGEPLQPSYVSFQSGAAHNYHSVVPSTLSSNTSEGKDLMNTGRYLNGLMHAASHNSYSERGHSDTTGIGGHMGVSPASIWLSEDYVPFPSEDCSNLQRTSNEAKEPTTQERRQPHQNRTTSNTNANSVVQMEVAKDPSKAIRVEEEHQQPPWIPLCGDSMYRQSPASSDIFLKPPLMSATGRIRRKGELMLYASTFIEKLFSCGMTLPEGSSVSLHSFLNTIMIRTRLSGNTLMTAFLYLDRLKKNHPRCKGSPGSAHRLILSAVILAAKYLYDDTFDNTAWATVSSGLFYLGQVNHMEMEMLQFLDFKLYVSSAYWQSFYATIDKDIEEWQATYATNNTPATPTGYAAVPSPASRMMPGNGGVGSMHGPAANHHPGESSSVADPTTATTTLNAKPRSLPPDCSETPGPNIQAGGDSMHWVSTPSRTAHLKANIQESTHVSTIAQIPSVNAHITAQRDQNITTQDLQMSNETNESIKPYRISRLPSQTHRLPGKQYQAHQAIALNVQNAHTQQQTTPRYPGGHMHEFNGIQSTPPETHTYVARAVEPLRFDPHHSMASRSSPQPPSYVYDASPSFRESNMQSNTQFRSAINGQQPPNGQFYQPSPQQQPNISSKNTSQRHRPLRPQNGGSSRPPLPSNPPPYTMANRYAYLNQSYYQGQPHRPPNTRQPQMASGGRQENQQYLGRPSSMLQIPPQI